MRNSQPVNIALTQLQYCRCSQPPISYPGGKPASELYSEFYTSMEKKLNSWKQSIKRSFGRKAGRDVALELQKSGQAPQPQAQQQGQAHQPDQKQSQPLQDAENLQVPPKKNRTWRTLKRGLGRKLGLRVREELEKEESEEQETKEEKVEDPVDAGSTFDQAIPFATQKIHGNLHAEPTRTTAPPARYRVKRTRVAGSEGCNKFSIRKNGAAVQGTTKSFDDSIRNLSALGLGTRPTTPGYPHPMEVAAAVPKDRCQYATWSARAKPFWCCNEHDGMVDSADLPPGSKSAPVHNSRVQWPGAVQGFEGVQPVCSPIKSEIVQADDGHSWPSSSNPGLLEPTLFRSVGSLSCEYRRGHGPQEDENAIQTDYGESAENFQPAEPVESSRGADALGAAVRDEVDDAAPEDQGEEQSTTVLPPAHWSSREEIYQATVQHQVEAGTVAADGAEEQCLGDLHAKPTDDGGKLQQIQASIASLQRAFPLGVEEGELEAIEEGDEGISPEEVDEEAALMRQALLDVVYSQRAASSALFALTQSAESLQGASRQRSSGIPTPGEWLNSRYGRSIGETAESSTASTPAYRARHRERAEARAERVRNWLAERERKKKTNGDVDDAPAMVEDTSSASNLELGTSESPFATSPSAALCAPRLPVRYRQQIARESTANHRTSIVINACTYSRQQQHENQPMSQAHQNAGADATLAVIEEDAEDLQAEPTDEEEIGESGSAPKVQP